MRIAIVATCIIVFAAGCVDGAATLPNPDRAALRRAHEAYLSGDTLAVSLALKEVLLDEAVDPSVRDNALGLLDKTYELHDGVVPADWSLPKGLEKLTFNQVRVEEPGETSFVVSLSGFVDDPARFIQLSLSRGAETYLDKATGRGTLTSNPEKAENHYFSFETRVGHSVGPGVYTMRLELRDAAAVDGWVIAGDIVAAGASRIHAPAVGAIVDGNPTLAFEDYTSPGYRPFEHRSLSIYVSQAGHPSWELWTPEPGFTELVLGKDPRGAPAGALAPGRHWIALTFGEKRRFGPVDICRASRAQQPFEVR